MTKAGVCIFSEGDKVIYRQPERVYKMELERDDVFGLHKGKGFIEEGTLIPTPMDFSKKNYASLRALNQILKRLIFPDQFTKEESFDLTTKDYEFLKYWMSRTPPEVEVPYYDRNDYYDSYCKFLMYGDLKGEMSDQIRIYNKVGLAFGTLTDVAYIKDHQGVEFLLPQRFWLIITKYLTMVNMSTTSWGFLSLGLWAGQFTNMKPSKRI